VAAAAGAVLIIVGAYGAVASAARMLGQVAVLSAVALASLGVGVLVTVVAVRVRGRRTSAAAAPPPVLWQQRPDALPGPPRRELPAAGGKHLHLHFGDMSPEQAAEIIRSAAR
jgi:hypothetical protein